MANFCARVGWGRGSSIHGVLHRECFNLFPDELLASLFTDVVVSAVRSMIVAVVMGLQRIEGLSDREAVERFAFDARCENAAGGLDFHYLGFVHTWCSSTCGPGWPALIGRTASSRSRWRQRRRRVWWGGNGGWT